jgi:2-oxoglutarate ferredoxin oxidoreductase subunit delta
MAKGLIVINANKCKGCGLCIDVCPQKLIELGDFFNNQGYRPATFKNSGKCKGCALCAIICPDIAIEVYREAKDEEKDINER